MSDHGPRRRILRAALAAVVGLFLLGGCVRIDGDLTIDGTASSAPDTVSGTVLVAVSDDWAIAHGTDPDDLSDTITEELASASGTGVTGEPYSEGGYTGVTFTFDEVPIDRLSAATDNTLTITRDGESYVVRGDLSGLDEPEEDGGDPTPWTVRLSLTLPTDVSEHNGDLQGRTVTWDLDETSSDATILAVSSVGPVSWWTKIPAALWILTALAGVGALLAWWLSRRQRDDDGGFRARQARARSGSVTKLDDMLATAKRDERGSRPRTGNRKAR